MSIQFFANPISLSKKLFRYQNVSTSDFPIQKFFILQFFRFGNFPILDFPAQKFPRFYWSNKFFRPKTFLIKLFFIIISQVQRFFWIRKLFSLKLLIKFYRVKFCQPTFLSSNSHPKLNFFHNKHLHNQITLHPNFFNSSTQPKTPTFHFKFSSSRPPKTCPSF